MPRTQGKPTVQATLEPLEREMFNHVVETVRQTSGVRASEADVLRKLIRDAATAAGWKPSGAPDKGPEVSGAVIGTSLAPRTPGPGTSPRPGPGKTGARGPKGGA